MNEFDKIPDNDQPEAERTPLPDADMPGTDSPASDAPDADAQADAGNTSENTPSEPPIADGTSYSYTRDQLTDATTQVGGWQQSAAEGSTDQAPSGEYEVSFDSVSGKYTYTDHSAPSEAPQPERPTSRKRGLLALGLCVTVLASVLLGTCGGALAAYRLVKTAPADESSSLHNHVQQSTVIQVSNSPVDYGAIAAATSKCYDSVVLIRTYASESAAEAGEHSGSGSGVVLTADGYIVTCNHVVDSANVVRVILTDGTAYYADVVGTDAQTDLAVLKIQAGELIPAIARNTDLVLGETTIAIGTPLGFLTNTVSDGILSSLTREISIEGQTMSLLQTTAAVNEGNSGGGLFDINGSLIGIVNAKSTGESVEGLGYAIPITTVTEISAQLIEQGFVSGRPQIGISCYTLPATQTTRDTDTLFSDPNIAGLRDYATRVDRVFGGSQVITVPGLYITDASSVVGYADGSDSLKYGDLLLYVGNKEITSITDVKAALTGYSAGDTLQLTVLRDQNRMIVINLILGST